jgi:hypothetical protein
MADNIVGGLFGVDPAQLQQQRMAQDLKEGFMLAQLSPMERATAGIYAGSKQLGRAGQSLLGMEDPQLQEAAMAKKISENFDVNSVSGLRGLAAELQKAGSLRYSQLAAQQANQLEATVGKAALTEAQTVKALREQRIPTSPLGKLMFERQELLNAGVPTTDPRVVSYDRAIAAEGEPKGTRISIDQKGESAFRTNLAGKDAERVTNAEKIIDSAVGTLNTLKQMTETNNVGVISGTGAEARVSALKFLDTAGFTTPSEKTKLANSENFEKLTGDLVLERIKQLGTNPSNADREFINKIVPQLSTSALARQQLITYMSNRANQVIQEASSVSDYGRKNDSLKGYKPTIPLLNINTTNRPITSYSTEELTAMQNQRK